MTDKMERDFRRSVEFILSIKPYTEAELLAKDVVTFMQILSEAEEVQIERNLAMKKLE